MVRATSCRGAGCNNSLSSAALSCRGSAAIHKPTSADTTLFAGEWDSKLVSHPVTSLKERGSPRLESCTRFTTCGTTLLWSTVVRLVKRHGRSTLVSLSFDFKPLWCCADLRI